MNVEIVDFRGLSEIEQRRVADLVSDYTHGKSGESPQMLPVQSGDILEKEFGAVALLGQHFSGYIGAATPEKHKKIAMSEIGTLWVPRVNRGKNTAHLLVDHMTSEVARVGIKPYAFCNPLSLHIFEELMYSPKASGDVPASALSACHYCTAKPATGCCDTIVVYEGDKNDN